jgi:hypothetical protein
MGEIVEEVAKGLDKSIWEKAWWSEKSMEAQRGDWGFCGQKWTRRNQLVSLPKGDPYP